MTEYGYYNLPDELNVHPIPEDFLVEGYEALQEVMGTDLVKAQEIKIAYVYDRNGQFSADTFAGPRNKSYGGQGDDIVIQWSVRISDSRYFGGGKQSITKLAALEDTIKDFDRKAEQKRLATEIAEAEAEAEAAAAKVALKRKQLEALEQK